MMWMDDWVWMDSWVDGNDIDFGDATPGPSPDRGPDWRDMWDFEILIATGVVEGTISQTPTSDGIVLSRLLVIDLPGTEGETRGGEWSRVLNQANLAVR